MQDESHLRPRAFGMNMANAIGFDAVVGGMEVNRVGVYLEIRPGLFSQHTHRSSERLLSTARALGLSHNQRTIRVGRIHTSWVKAK